MSSNSELRKEIARLRISASRKIARHDNLRNIDLTGTKYDPRRAKGVELRYTNRQLLTYRANLQNFMSRKTQFYGTAKGGIITAAQWRSYKNVERQYNKFAVEEFSRYAKLKLPTGETIAQRMGKVTPTHRRMGSNPSVNSPYQGYDRDPKNIASFRSLKRLTDSLARRLTDDHKEVSESRKQFNEMISVIGDAELERKINALTDEQFKIAWRYGGLAEKIALEYEMAMKLLTDKDSAFANEIMTTMGKEAHSIVDWASKIKPRTIKSRRK
jgi:hypothetical protein